MNKFMKLSIINYQFTFIGHLSFTNEPPQKVWKMISEKSLGKWKMENGKSSEGGERG